MSDKFQTYSERLFATYLDAYGYSWEYEPKIPGKSKIPDFSITRDSMTFLVDVKERAPTPTPLGATAIDPVEGVRKKIEEGRKKFKDFDEQVCGLVLYNNGDHATRINPWCVFGAMLGEPGISIKYDAAEGKLCSETTRSEFLLRGGKMIRHYSPFTPRESTKNIRAIIIPSMYDIPNKRFAALCNNKNRRLAKQFGRPLSLPEQIDSEWKVAQKVARVRDRVPRVVACDNPFADPFPECVFNAEYDERWAIKDGTLQRIFAGAAVADTEPDEWDGF